jgi:hypothetical protein
MVHISEISLWQPLYFRVSQSGIKLYQVFTSTRRFSDDVWRGDLVLLSCLSVVRRFPTPVLLHLGLTASTSFANFQAVWSRQ